MVWSIEFRIFYWYLDGWSHLLWSVMKIIEKISMYKYWYVIFIWLPYWLCFLWYSHGSGPCVCSFNWCTQTNVVFNNSSTILAIITFCLHLLEITWCNRVFLEQFSRLSFVKVYYYYFCLCPKNKSRLTPYVPAYVKEFVI